MRTAQSYSHLYALSKSQLWEKNNLELMARDGMRIGEVLKLRVRNVDDCKLLIEQPKSGRQSEVVFIPKKVAERLKEYIRSKSMEPDHRIFPIGYTGARAAVKKAGLLVGVDLHPHDLRRHFW